MPLVPDPNCYGTGKVAVYTGAVNEDGSADYTELVPDPRCGGTGVIEKPAIFLSTERLGLIQAGYDPDATDPRPPKLRV